MDKDITITDFNSSLTEDTIYIDNDSIDLSQFTFSNSNYNIGAIGSSGSFLTSTGANGTSWNTINYNTASTPSSLSVTGDAEFEGDVKIKGVSIAKALEDIQSRLAILVPDPAKLEHFAALKKAYDHYKTLEALCEIPKEDDSE